MRGTLQPVVLGVTSDRLRDAVPPLLLMLGGLHGMAAATAAWLRGRQDGTGLELSPLAVLALAASAAVLWRHRARMGTPAPWATAMFVLALLVPSGSVANLATAAYGLHVAARARPPARGALACIALVALWTLWIEVGQHFVVDAFLRLDAMAATTVLHWGGIVAWRDGNVVATSALHRIAVRPGCATALMLPLVPVAAAAVALAARDGLRHWPLAAAALAFAALNIVRLAFLAISADDYSLGHGPIGQNVFDGATIGLVAIFGLAASATPAATPSGRPSPDARPVSASFILLAAVVAVIAILPKGIRYAAPDAPDPNAPVQVAVRFMADEGWSLRDDLPRNTAQGTVLMFARPGCADTVTVTLLASPHRIPDRRPLRPEPDAAYLDAGHLSGDAPGFWAIRLTWRSVLAELGIARARPMPPALVRPAPPAQAVVCAPPPAAHWQRLATLDGGGP